MGAGALNCPNCGAAVTTDSPQCPYCRSLLQTIGCTRCKSMMFMGTKHCPHCGVAADVPIVGMRTDKVCPRCEIPLMTVQLSLFVIEQCIECGGVWMPVEVLDRICSDAETRAAALALALPEPRANTHAIKYIACPACRQPMGRINYAKRSGVMLDTCRDHGIWLDRDELQRIVEFIHAGGLERSRLLEKQKLDAARRALEFERRTDRGPFGDNRGDDGESAW